VLQNWYMPQRQLVINSVLSSQFIFWNKLLTVFVLISSTWDKLVFGSEFCYVNGYYTDNNCTPGELLLPFNLSQAPPDFIIGVSLQSLPPTRITDCITSGACTLLTLTPLLSPSRPLLDESPIPSIEIVGHNASELRIGRTGI